MLFKLFLSTANFSWIHSRKITSGFWAHILSSHFAHNCIRIKTVISDLCLASRPSRAMLFKVWSWGHLYQNCHTFISENFFLSRKTQGLLNLAICIYREAGQFMCAPKSGSTPPTNKINTIPFVNSSLTNLQLYIKILMHSN